MIYRPHLAFLVLCPVALIVGSVAPAHAAGAASAKVIALRVSDLPSGFKPTFAGSIGAAAFARDYGVSVSTAKSEGRIDGYETKFGRRSSSGVVYVDDQVTTFKSSGGAHWGYSVALTTTGSGRRVSIGRVGDQNSTYSYGGKSRGISITAYVIVFRRGGYLGLLAASGVTGRFKSGEVLHFAQILDSRMRRGG